MNTLNQIITEQSRNNNATLSIFEKRGKTIEDTEQEMEVHSCKYDRIFVTFYEQNRTTNDLIKQIKELERTLIEKDSALIERKSGVSALELYSRRSNIQVHGMDKKEREYSKYVVINPKRN